MAKWADYCISAVRYNSQRTHIDVVRVHEDGDDKIGSPSEMSRAGVINAIAQGYTFVTIYLNTQKNWTKGAAVIVVPINGTQYIKTKSDNTPKDNLENLPEMI